jgi:hypothetical protein
MDILSVNFQQITEKTEEPVKQQHIHQRLLITDNLS